MEKVDALVLEFSAKILEGALTLLAEAGEPLDIDEHVRAVGKFRNAEFSRDCFKRRSCGRFEGFESTLFGVEFPTAVGELLSKARMREKNGMSSGYVAPVGLDVIPVYGKPNGDAECFILATIGELAGSRLYPLVIPHDVIDFSVSLLRSKTDRIRFLSELTSIYCDAVRLSGKSIGLGRKLLASLRNLVGLLGVTLREETDSQASDASPGADEGGNSSDIHTNQHKEP